MSEDQGTDGQEAEYRAFLATGAPHMQRCAGCETVRHPPRWICPNCLGMDWSWQPLAGTGCIETFVWYFESLDPRFTEVPYNVAIVQLDEGVRIITNILAVEFGEISVGQQVRAKVERDSQGKPLLCFVLHGPASSA